MLNDKILKLRSERWIKQSSGMEFAEVLVDHPIELHWHEFIEIELVVAGSGSQLFNGKKIELKKGSFYISRLTDFHQIEPNGKMLFYSIKVDESKFSKKSLNEFFKNNELIYLELNEEEFSVVESLFNLCKAENTMPDRNVEYIKNLINCILMKTLKKSENTLSAAKSAGETPLQAAILYLNMHFRENPTLAQVANIAGYNPSHFSSIFHKEVGMTYSEYLNILKLSYTKELLLSTNLKISEICFECGFTSISNFLRLFKESTGISPLKYRKVGNESKK